MIHSVAVISCKQKHRKRKSPMEFGKYILKNQKKVSKHELL